MSVVALSVADMIIDCDRCTVRGAACPRCAVTFITGRCLAGEPEPVPGLVPGLVPEPVPVPVPESVPGLVLESVPESVPASRSGPSGETGSPQVIELDAVELRSLGTLANAGLIPPLRYAPSMAKAS